MPVSPTFTVDREIPFAPEIELNAMIRYEWPLEFGYLALQVDGTYTSDNYLQLNSFSTNANNSYVIANVLASVTSRNERWRLYARANNVMDEDYEVSAFDTSSDFGNLIVAFNKPRAYEVGLRYSW